TGLGIVGLASFWVQQRTRQIGIRRALGATRTNIVRYFQLENFILASAGVVLADRRGPVVGARSARRARPGDARVVDLTGECHAQRVMSTVLVIDDNPAVATALEVLLSLRDLRTLHAESPSAGLSVLAREPVDVVIQ